MENYFGQMQALLEEGTSFVCVTLVDIKGSTPRAQGGRMLVTVSGLYSGTVGGGLVEAKALEFSQEFLQQNELSGQTKFVQWNLNRDIGMSCGGSVKLYFERFNTNPWEIMIFGAGHVGQELSSKSVDLDFNVHLIDSRNEYLKIQNEKEIIPIFTTFPWMLIKNLPKKSYYIVLTHNHDYDFKIINEILNLNTFQFIGLIGSKTKRKRFSNRLVKLGHNQHLINKIECPIGLNNIISKKPGEIAISIIARLLEYRTNISSIQIDDKQSLKIINEQ